MNKTTKKKKKKVNKFNCLKYLQLIFWIISIYSALDIMLSLVVRPKDYIPAKNEGQADAETGLLWNHWSGSISVWLWESRRSGPLSQVSLTGFSWGLIVVWSKYPFSLSLTFVSPYLFLFLFQMIHGRIYLERRGSGKKGKTLQKSLSKLLAPILGFSIDFSLLCSTK